MRRFLMITVLMVAIAAAVTTQFVPLQAGGREDIDPEYYTCVRTCSTYYSACENDPGTTSSQCTNARSECNTCCQLIQTPSWPVGLPPF